MYDEPQDVGGLLSRTAHHETARCLTLARLGIGPIRC